MADQKDTKEHLVEVALRLFVSRGYHNTSIDDIARESGYTKGTFRYYFSSKEELARAAIDEALGRFVRERAAGVPGPDRHVVDRLLVILGMPSVGELPPAGYSPTDVAIRIASAREDLRKHMETRVAFLVEEVERMIAKAVADGQVADDVDPRQLAQLVLVMGAGIQLSRLLFGRHVNFDQARHWVREYLNSLRR